MNEFLKLAIKSLKLNKIRTFLTMLGIIIGVAAVIILTSIVGGLQKTITTQFESFGSNTLFLFPGKTGGSRGPGGSIVNKLTFDMGNKVANVEGVTDVSVLVFTTGTAKYKNKESDNVTTYGVDSKFFTINKLETVKGRQINNSDISGVKLNVVIGEDVRKNLFENIDPIGKEITVKGIKYTVVGILEKRGAVFGQSQDNTVYVPVSVARTRYQIDRPNFFYIRLQNLDNVDAVKKNINNVIKQYITEDDFSVVSQEQSLDFIKSILGVLATALGGIAAISLIVGGVGIMNIMFVSVTERTKEIGLRKAIGASSTNVLTQFLLEAIILSVLGGLFGVVIGIGFSYVIGFFIDTALNPFYITLSFLVSAIIGIIFGVAPAIKASKLDPIVALRYE